MRRIAILNQKGGVGKTTTTANVGAALARAGHRVLIVDLDPQAHLTLHLGLDPGTGQPGTHHLLTSRSTILEARRQVATGLWVVGSSIDLAGTEVELVSVVGREVILRDLLEQHISDNGQDPPYDYVLMDCPPALSVLTLNGLCAAHEVCIPLQPHYLALQGLSKLLETVALVNKRINPQLEVTGVVVCMRDTGTRLAAEVIDDVREFFEEGRGQNVPWSEARVFDTPIRRNIKLAEAPSYGKSIFDYAPESNGAKDYERLALEIHDPALLVEKEQPAVPAAPAEPPVDRSHQPAPSPDPLPVPPLASPVDLVDKLPDPALAAPVYPEPLSVANRPRPGPSGSEMTELPPPLPPVATRPAPAPPASSPSASSVTVDEST